MYKNVGDNSVLTRNWFKYLVRKLNALATNIALIIAPCS